MTTTLRHVLGAPIGAALLVAALLAGCGGGGSGGDVPVAAVSNSAPRAAITLSGQLVSANGTGDAATYTGADVKFDAGASADPDGDALTFSWSLVSKPASSSADIKGDRRVDHLESRCCRHLCCQRARDRYQGRIRRQAGHGHRHRQRRAGHLGCRERQLFRCADGGCGPDCHGGRQHPARRCRDQGR